VQDYTKNLLGGGGATDQAGAVNQNYQNYYNQTNPLASNTNYNPMSTPGFSDALNTQIADITNGTNGQFAAAGRDFSGANSMALGRGISQGIAPTIAAQYNQNVQNQQGAAGNLYNAGNTNSGILAGLQQQKLANQGQGVTAMGQATDAANAGANATLQAEAARRGIPVQALGMLAQIGIPIAGLGGQSTGQSQGTQQMSGAQQFATIAGGALSPQDCALWATPGALSIRSLMPCRASRQGNPRHSGSSRSYSKPTLGPASRHNRLTLRCLIRILLRI
jgi:hypothetical protein